jgi:hypothetical protein
VTERQQWHLKTILGKMQNTQLRYILKSSFGNYTIKQIIVSPQGEDFQRILLEQLTPPSGKSRIIYDLHDWDQHCGPRVTKSIQEAPEI